jgi:SsrA-binding protein
MTAAAEKRASATVEILATNRKARHAYHVLERVEAGIALRGAEVKSIRQREVSVAESFARIEGGEVVLHNLHVQPYRHSTAFLEDPRRPRRLLLHRREIARLAGQVTARGRALVPLSMYLKRGRVKVELGLCEGKLVRDKRETLRRRTAELEARRAIAARKG